MVRTFSTSNPPNGDGARKYGIYPLRDLRNRPLTCKIGDVRLAFKLTGYKQPQAAGNCGAVEDGKAIVTLNGKTLVAMTYTHGGCWNLVSHTVEIFLHPSVNLYELRHCRMIEEVVAMQPLEDELIPGARCTDERDKEIVPSSKPKAP